MRGVALSAAQGEREAGALALLLPLPAPENDTAGVTVVLFPASLALGVRVPMPALALGRLPVGVGAGAEALLQLEPLCTCVGLPSALPLRPSVREPSALTVASALVDVLDDTAGLALELALVLGEKDSDGEPEGEGDSRGLRDVLRVTRAAVTESAGVLERVKRAEGVGVVGKEALGVKEMPIDCVEQADASGAAVGLPLAASLAVPASDAEPLPVPSVAVLEKEPALLPLPHTDALGTALPVPCSGIESVGAGLKEGVASAVALATALEAGEGVAKDEVEGDGDAVAVRVDDVEGEAGALADARALEKAELLPLPVALLQAVGTAPEPLGSPLALSCALAGAVLEAELDTTADAVGSAGEREANAEALAVGAPLLALADWLVLPEALRLPLLLALSLGLELRVREPLEHAVVDRDLTWLCVGCVREGVGCGAVRVAEARGEPEGLELALPRAEKEGDAVEECEGDSVCEASALTLPVVQRVAVPEVQPVPLPLAGAVGVPSSSVPLGVPDTLAAALVALRALEALTLGEREVLKHAVIEGLALELREVRALLLPLRVMDGEEEGLRDCVGAGVPEPSALGTAVALKEALGGAEKDAVGVGSDGMGVAEGGGLPVCAMDEQPEALGAGVAVPPPLPVLLRLAEAEGEGDFCALGEGEEE